MSTRELAEKRKSVLMQLFKNSGTGKLPAIKRYLGSLLANPTTPKFLVFAHHHSVLDALESSVLRGVPIVRIDGRTPPRERQARIARFQVFFMLQVAFELVAEPPSRMHATYVSGGSDRTLCAPGYHRSRRGHHFDRSVESDFHGAFLDTRCTSAS